MNTEKETTLIAPTNGVVKATVCHMPRTHKQNDVLKKIHHMFCDHIDRDKSDHTCRGVIVISSQCMILRCKLCGDSKSLLTEEI